MVLASIIALKNRELAATVHMYGGLMRDTCRVLSTISHGFPALTYLVVKATHIVFSGMRRVKTQFVTLNVWHSPSETSNTTLLCKDT